jgi:hypothetical protein
MTCAFFSLLAVVVGLGALAGLGWRRIAAHLSARPEAARMFVEHIVTPVLLGGKTKGPGGTAPSRADDGPAE